MMSRDFTVHTSLLFSPTEKRFLSDVSIVVSPKTGLIKATYKRSVAESEALGHVSPPDVDLRSKDNAVTVLPGLVDAHTHIFLHSYLETPSVNQMRDESPTERTIRATNHLRAALLAGYTTYRDLGTEGMRNDDTHVRDAVNRGIIPGPRLFVATECIAGSGGYEVRVENDSLPAPRISDVADGVDGVRAAVRRRVGAGADVIKFYADYRKRQLVYPPSNWPGQPEIRFPPSKERRNDNYPLFSQDEMDSIVEEARANRIPVASHAQGEKAIIMAINAGVTSLEHGLEMSDEAIEAMKKHGTIFVPTLSVFELFFPQAPFLKQTNHVWKKGVKLAAGGDTGAFAHGENARELELLLDAGLPVEDVLTAATLTGWEACGGKACGRDFGSVEAGFAADLIALDGDVRHDRAALRKVDFVMKDGRIWKENGKAIGMA